MYFVLTVKLGVFHTDVAEVDALPFLPLLVQRILDFSVRLQVWTGLALRAGGTSSSHLLHIAQRTTEHGNVLKIELSGISSAQVTPFS